MNIETYEDLLEAEKADLLEKIEKLQARLALKEKALTDCCKGKVTVDAAIKMAEAALRFKTRLAKAEELLQEVSTSSVAFSDERIKYLEIQIDRPTWEEIKAFLPAAEKKA